MTDRQSTVEFSLLNYRSYLLRIWFSDDGEIWRARLHTVNGQEDHRFTDPESLCAFLRSRTQLNSRKEEKR